MLNNLGQEEADKLPAQEDEMTALPGTASNLPGQRPVSILGWSMAIALGLLLWVLILAALGVMQL